MEIQSLRDIPFDQLYASFSEAFSDYEIQLSAPELNRMLQRRGFRPDLSFGAFSSGTLVSFTFNGIGTWKGLPTAYDTGTGTVREHRGKGLARQIFSHSLTPLRKAGIGQYLLEVLQHNQKAVGLYQKLGFTISREFSYHIQEKSVIRVPGMELPGEYIIQSISPEFLLNHTDFDEYDASWQNSFEAISRSPGDFEAVATYFQDILVGYCIYEPQGGDLTRLSVTPGHRRKGIASKLLFHATEQIDHENVKVINVPLEARDFSSFLSSCNFPLSGMQYEMILDL